MPKPRYKTTNWKQHNQSLINRGSLTGSVAKIEPNPTVIWLSE
ncbi:MULTISPECIES: hypothetical protein [Vibrio]|nr:MULTISPECIES: hypothetical protein [Vibrio]